MRIVAWLGVALTGFYLVFLGGASNFLPSPQARIVTQAVILASTLAWLAAQARARAVEARPRSRLILPGLVFVTAMIASALFSSRPESSREALALLLLALPGYLVVRSVLGDAFLRRRVDWLVVVMAVILVVGYLAQVGGQWLAWWSAVGPSIPPLRPGDVGLTIGTANAVAAYAELLVAPAAWVAWGRWRRRGVATAIAVLGAIALLITGSRGAWLGAAAGVLLVGSLRLRARRTAAAASGEARAPSTRRASWRPSGRAILAGAAGLVVVSALGVLVGGRFFASDAGRIELWTAGLQVFAAHPVLGGGPGAWQGLRPLTDISNANYAVLYTPDSSRVAVLAETGLVGLVAWAILAGAIGRLAWQSTRDAPDEPSRIAREIDAACLLALGVHSLVDPMFHIPAVVLLILLLVARLELGLAAAAPPATTGSGMRAHGRDRLQLAGAAVTCVVATALLVPIDVAMVQTQRGMDALDAGRYADARPLFDQAVALHELAPYRVGQAIALAALGATADAEASLVRAGRSEPFTFILAQRAWLLAERGDEAGALAIARSVAERGYDTAATLGAAVLLARSPGTGDQAQGRSLLRDVLVDVPSLTLAPTPPSQLVDASLWQGARLDALAEIRRGSPGAAALLELRAGLHDLATADLAAATEPQRRALELLRDALGGAPADLAAGRDLLRLAVQDQVVLAALDRLARIARSNEDIRRVQEVSIATFFDVPPPDREIRLDGGPGDRLVMALPRWPNAADSRLGPRRPFVPGFPTIQPVM
jgi:putative inorganic carbon (HCO3(-)) transporter